MSSLRWIVEFGGRTLTPCLNGPNAVVRSLHAMPVQQIVSPIDGSVYAERTTVSPDELEDVLARAAGARAEWQETPLADRQSVNDVDDDAVQPDLVQPILARLDRVVTVADQDLAHRVGVVGPHDEVDVVLALRSSASPDGVAAGEREGDGFALERRRDGLEDLALFLDLAARAGMSGIQEWLSFYWKSPMTAPNLYPEHDLFIQLMKLKNTLRHLMGEQQITHLGLEYYAD